MGGWGRGDDSNEEDEGGKRGQKKEMVGVKGEREGTQMR